MPLQNKKRLSERDICTKFIAPALTRGGKWDIVDQVREEVSLTKGRVIVRGQLSARGEGKRADYVLYYKPGLPLAVIEAKDNNRSVAAGMRWCDELEAQLVTAETAGAALLDSSLHALLAPAD